MTARTGTLVVACGALAAELGAVVEANGLDHVSIDHLPAKLHNTPERIVDALRSRLEGRVGHYTRVLIGYADCGTGGGIDRLCAELGVERLPGAHCYEMFAGAETFAALHAAEPGTFYLTDYLAKHFDRLVMDGLGITAHPALATTYFANYRRLVHLAQRDDARIDGLARDAARRLGLAHERRFVGYGDLQRTLTSGTTAVPVALR